MIPYYGTKQREGDCEIKQFPFYSVIISREITEKRRRINIILIIW